MGQTMTYGILLADHYEAYMVVTAEEVLGAVRAILGPNARGYLEDSGLHYKLQSWDITITGTPFALRLTFAGTSTRGDRDRLMESLVRNLESAGSEQLSWSTLDGAQGSQEDGASGEIVSPALDEG